MNLALHPILPPFLGLVLGAVLLVAGRRLFWLLVGVTGFLIGLQLGLQLGLGSEGLRWLVAIFLGLAGLALAKAFQKVAVALVGFFLGASAVADYLHLDPLGRPAGGWIFVLIAGILGGILAVRLFEVALIAFSSYLGAILVIDALRLPATTLMIVLLFVAGVVVQSSLFGGRRRAAT